MTKDNLDVTEATCIYCGATEDEHDGGECMLPATPTFTPAMQSAREPKPAAPPTGDVVTKLEGILDAIAEGELFAEDFPRELRDRLDATLQPADPQCDETLREVLAEGYIALSGKQLHASDCATSNAPAMLPGPCDCDMPVEPKASDDPVERITAWLYARQGGVSFELLEPFDQEHWRKQAREVAAITTLRASDPSRELVEAERILKWTLDAINAGRSEPLFIARDTIRNYFEDRAALAQGLSR